MKPIHLFILLVLCCLSAPVTASIIGLWYSAANPDYKPFETGYGWAITLEQYLSDDWQLKYNHYETDFPGSGPEVSGIDIETWQEFGVAYDLDEVLEGLYLYASYTEVTATDQSLTGPGYHIGYRLHWSNGWSGFIQVGEVDTGFFDIQLEAQAQYQWTKNLSLAIGLRDHHKWDMTNYHLGLKWQF